MCGSLLANPEPTLRPPVCHMIMLSSSTCGHVAELATKDMATLGVMGWWWQKLGLLCDLMKQKHRPNYMMNLDLLP